MRGIFWWLDGVRSDRNYVGPWWFNWFTSEHDAKIFYKDMQARCYLVTEPIPMDAAELNRVQTSGAIHPPAGICPGCIICNPKPGDANY